jgi:UDP-N-acetylmuramyl pentapeptide phosphotransferase/UDP-N-acetylglucosamine-1-phosphate transferase
MNSHLVNAISAFVLSTLGVGLTLLYARRIGLLDVPNERSSHSRPTPRGGGIALVIAVLVITAVELTQLGSKNSSLFAFLAATLFLLAVVGWLDDRGSLPIAVRLPAQIACGIAVAFLVNEIAPFPVPLNILWLAWWAFWTVASINIVNFMDGIDGMVASQGLVYGLFLFAAVPGGLIGSQFGLILAGACAGLLLWNWAPAKIFMGDVGSGPLGLFFVIGGALALEGMYAALVFLPLFPLFFDALITIILRARHGERLTDAHRSHLYQRLANSGYGHALVTSIYALAAAIGAVIALFARGNSGTRMAFAISVYVVAIGCGWKILDSRVARSAEAASS